MLRDLWGNIAYYIFLGILIIVGLFCGKLKIHAQTINSWSTNQVKINTCDGNGTCTNSSNYDGNKTFSGSALSYPLNYVEWRLKSSDGLSKDNYYTFTFGYKPTPDAIAVKTQPYMKKSGDYDNESISCSNKYNSGWYLWTCSFEPRVNYSSDEFLYVRIVFYQSYLTSFQTRMDGYKVMQGVGGTIINQTNILNSTIQEQIEATNQTNEKLDDINNKLGNTTIDSPNSYIDTFNSLLPTNNTISSLITLPISLYQKILNSINGTCASFNLGSLYGTNLIMPCIDVSDYIGSTLWSTIDIILSGVFVLIIGKKMVKAFNNFTSLKEGDVIND